MVVSVSRFRPRSRPPTRVAERIAAATILYGNATPAPERRQSVNAPQFGRGRAARDPDGRERRRGPR